MNNSPITATLSLCESDSTYINGDYKTKQVLLNLHEDGSVSWAKLAICTVGKHYPQVIEPTGGAR